MEGPQVKLPLAGLMKALREQGDDQLKVLVNKAMEELAERHQITVEEVLPLMDEMIERIREETHKFSPKIPYPPPNVNNMSIQLTLPVKGKVGVVEFNCSVQV